MGKLWKMVPIPLRTMISEDQEPWGIYTVKPDRLCLSTSLRVCYFSGSSRPLCLEGMVFFGSGKGTPQVLHIEFSGA